MTMPSDEELQLIAYDAKHEAQRTNRALMDALINPSDSRYVNTELAAIAAVKRAVIEALAREAESDFCDDPDSFAAEWLRSHLPEGSAR